MPVRSLVGLSLLLWSVTAANRVVAQNSDPMSNDQLDELADSGEGEILVLDDGSRWLVDADGNMYPLAEKAAEIVVTGSRLGEREDQRSVKVDQVDAQEIAERGDRNLADLLADEVGVQVTSSLGTGKSIIMDGLDGKYVLVLVDGRPVYGRVNSRLDLSRVDIDPETIERIDIVRGPMSAIYGSEALGGVINIITRKPSQDLKASLALDQLIIPKDLLSPGSGLQTVGSAHLSGSAGMFAGTLDLSGSWARPYDRDGDGKTDLSGRSQGKLRSQIDAYLSPRQKMSVYTNLSNVVLDAKVTASAPFANRLRDNAWTLGTSLDQSLRSEDALKADLRFDNFEHLSQRATQIGNYTNENTRTRIRQHQLRSDLSYSAPLLSKQDWVYDLRYVVGAMGSAEHASRTNDLGLETLQGQHGRVLAAAFGELRYQPWQFLSIVPGLRADLATGSLEAIGPVADDGQPSAVHSHNDYNLGPKLSLRANGPWGLALRASYGEGFRTPTFLERYLVFDHSEQGFYILGDPYLRPERSRGLRVAALAQPIGRLQLEAEYYINLLQDLIDYAYVGDTDDGLQIFRSTNIARAYTSGLNLSANMRNIGDRVDVQISYQYLLAAVDSSQCSADNPYFCDNVTSLPLRPAHSAHGKITWHNDRIGTRLFAHIELMSERPQIEDDGQYLEIPGHALVGLGWRQKISPKTEFSLLVDNLTDAYHPIYGPKPGRSVWLGFRAQH